MLRIPESLDTSPSNRCVHLPGATVVSYRAKVTLEATPFLVTQPTLVFVHKGTKRLQPHGTSTSVVARENHFVAMRSGTHFMSEIAPTPAAFQSTVVSFERDLLRSTIGTIHAPARMKRAVASPTPSHLIKLVASLPKRLTQRGEDAERLLRIRELILVATNDEKVRAVLFEEVASWTEHARRIPAVMTAHCLSPLSVADYAELCAMSLSSFKRHFRASYNEAPGRWLARTRLHHARSMLLAGDRSVTEICFACGFGDLSNFIRAFRNQYGAAPATYRRAHG